MPNFRRSNISRQFTDAEAALDDRVSSHLAAPPIEFDITAGVGKGYKWLKEDLELRSELTRQLAGEQAMSYAQSERHAMAEQAREQDEMDIEALSGIRRVREMLESGQAKDPNEAIYRASGENERLGINPVFGKMAADLGRTFENPQQRELRQRKYDLDMAKLQNDKFIVDAQNMTNEAIGTVEAAKRNVERFQQEGVTAANNAIYEENRGIVVREALRQSKEAKSLFEAIGDTKNRTARIRAQGMLGKLGLSDVADIESLAQLASQDELTLGALMDVTGRNEILDTPEKQQLYIEQWNTLSTAAPGSPEYRKALSGIDAVTAAWDERNRLHVSRANMNSAMSEISKDFADPWEKVSREIDSIVQKPTSGSSKMTEKDKPAAMLNTYARFLTQMQGQGADDVVAKYARMIGEQLSAANQPRSTLNTQAVNEFISASALGFSQEFKAAKAQAMLGKKNIEKAAKAVDDAAPVKVSTPEEASKLPSGTLFVGPDGVTRKRP